MQSSHTWKVATNVRKGMTDADGLKAMMDVRVATSKLLAKAGKYPLISEHLGDTSAAEQKYIATRMTVSGVTCRLQILSLNHAIYAAQPCLIVEGTSLCPLL